jgi:hypothetical protein
LEDVGLAMINAVEIGYQKQILENLDITQLAKIKFAALDKVVPSPIAKSGRRG